MPHAWCDGEGNWTGTGDWPTEFGKHPPPPSLFCRSLFPFLLFSSLSLSISLSLTHIHTSLASTSARTPDFLFYMCTCVCGVGGDGWGESLIRPSSSLIEHMSSALCCICALNTPRAHSARPVLKYYAQTASMPVYAAC